MPLAVAGDAPAQHYIGALYNRGEGVPRNYAAAARWFRRAADQGVSEAQFTLGVMYTLGYGVPQNDAEAAAGIAALPTRDIRERSSAWAGAMHRAGACRRTTCRPICGSTSRPLVQKIQI